MLFLFAVGALLLLPICILLVLRQTTDDDSHDQQQGEDRISRLQFARWFAMFSTCMPPVNMLLSLVSVRLAGIQAYTFTCSCRSPGCRLLWPPLFCFYLSGRGSERIMGPFASLIAGAMSVFLMWAGMAAA